MARLKIFATFSIQLKLFFTLGIGVFGFILYVGLNFVIARSNRSNLETLVSTQLPILESSENLTLAFAGVKNAVVQSALSGSADNIVYLDSSNKAVQNHLEELRRWSQEVDGLDKVTNRYNKVYESTTEILQNLVVGLTQLSDVQAELQNHSRELASLQTWALNLKNDRAMQFRGAIDSVNSGTNMSMYAGLALVVVMIPFAMFFFFVTRGVVRALKDVSAQLSHASQNMQSISDEALTSANRLASTASQQSMSVSESVASMQEMQHKLGQTVRFSGDALKSSDESFRQASDGKTSVDDLQQAMNTIERSSAQLEEVNRVVNLIGRKTTVIHEIVFQTQMLSFNASIEAARAGQHGRGFTVVAAEIGKLAAMSGKAAKEISELLAASTKSVNEIVVSTSEKVQSANAVSMECATVFDRITERAGEVKDLVNSISSAAEEQAVGIQQIGQAMKDVQDAAGDADKMAHVMSQLSNRIKSHSSTLAFTVDELDLLVHGERRHLRQDKVHDADIESVLVEFPSSTKEGEDPKDTEDRKSA